MPVTSPARSTISRTIVGSVSRSSPMPPQMPAIFLFVSERYRRLIQQRENTRLIYEHSLDFQMRRALQLPQVLYLRLLQMPPFPPLEPLIRNSRIGDPVELFHLVTERLEHAVDLPVPALTNDNPHDFFLSPGEIAQLCRSGLSVSEPDTFRQAPGVLGGEWT